MADRSVLVIASTASEVQDIESRIEGSLEDRLLTVSGDDARELTAVWERAQHPGRLVVATPRASTWQIAGLALAVILEEGRRAMKDRQTPTLHVRDMLATRARTEGFNLALIGPTPSVESLSKGPTIIKGPRRPWGLVEIVDRTNDPPGSGFVSERVVAALRAINQRGGSAFVFTHIRKGAASLRCTNCRTVKTCSRCGSKSGREPQCPRCGQTSSGCLNCGRQTFEEMGSVPERIARDIDNKIGSGTASTQTLSGSIFVGTERDLTRVSAMDLVVAVDADGLLLGQNYRSSEEALRVLARLGNLLGDGAGKRLMVQTSMPEADLLVALRRGEPIPYLESILAQRVKEGMPPASEIVAVEIRGGEPSADTQAELARLEDATVLGPAESDRGMRWLLTGSLTKARPGLRSLVQRWRESGLTVRIDADPIDL